MNTLLQRTGVRSLEAVVRKEYMLDGLCCPMCAEKIQKHLRHLDGVNQATVDVSSQKLTLDIHDPENLSAIVAQADKIIRQYEPTIRMSEISPATPGEKILYLAGLDCADCAGKIETRVRHIEGVQAAELDFLAQKLLIRAEDRTLLPAILRQASQLALELEPGIRISFTETEAAPTGANRKQTLRRAGLILGAALFAVGLLFDFPQPLDLVLFLVSFVFVGGEVVGSALRNISRGQVFDENFLMSVAT
ncbi:MAG: cation transporter, partial [Peptococcaceae bacterium]|nr:cation transporter [Peptococcaceae bacterium]